jgi:hypothetical protein
MNNHKINAVHLWKQFEDVLVPRLRLSATDRAVYSHLLRHTLLEGQTRLRFSIAWLARGSRVTSGPARQALRRLIAKGVFRLVERTRVGHVIEVRQPDEIRGVFPAGVNSAVSQDRGLSRPRRANTSTDIEQIDFLLTKPFRQSIHIRDRGLCFYCLCRLKSRARCLDHVMPLARSGTNSYRNLVSACVECNSQKGERLAPDFLRWLYRQGRLTATELTARLRALRTLAAGKLRPTLPM